LAEACKHGFKRAVVPFANLPKDVLPGMQVHGVKNLASALEVIDSAL